MNLEVVNGNILDKKYKVFCHQVNCHGVMGAGVALQIKNLYPNVYRQYRDYLALNITPLGCILPVKTPDDRICINMFAQDGYGKNRIYTRYDAFEACLRQLVLFCKDLPIDNCVAFPYGIGCGLAGGDWTFIKAMLNDFSNQIKQKVYVVKYE